MPAPARVRIRTYQVGFGDCFLLSFEYAGDKKRHVLVDFGSTGLPKDAPKNRMMQIARDIEKETDRQLDAVVATHRHKDHISGFATNAKGTGTGDIIRDLKPRIVIQPWTEDPKLEREATGPKKRKSGNALRVRGLANMQTVASQALEEKKATRYFRAELREQLSFLGDDNLANLSAVKNLMKMGAKTNYVFHGKSSGLARILPGVKVDVLGPPTVDQTDTIKTQRSKDKDEFWHLRVAAAEGLSNPQKRGVLFADRHVRSRGPKFPIDARWLIYHARTIRGEQLLQIVRMLDDAMNNTSVILLFTVGDKSLLFPGDAQIENWNFALSKPAIRDRLATVDLYKVGHHGSLNATPKKLWNAFANRMKTSDPHRLKTLMSTLEEKHGSEKANTEVPRRTLVSALESDSDFFTTQKLTGGDFFHDTVVTF